MKKLFVLLLVSLFIVGVFSVGVLAQEDEKVIRVGMWSSPGNMSAINADSSYGYFVVTFVYDTMAEMRPDFSFKGRLADDWTVSEDGKTFTFNLNPDATWHDGEALTAEDVLFTIKTVATPGVETNRGSAIRAIEGLDSNGKLAEGEEEISGVEVQGTHQIAITTKTALDPARFLEQFATNLYILPQHLLEGVAPEDLSKSEVLLNPTVGSGPFKFVKYETDQYIELAKNEDYYGEKAKVDKIFIRIVDATSIAAQLVRGEIDVTAGPGIGEIPLQDWDLIRDADNVRTVTEPALGYQFMPINNAQPYFEDVRVRRALLKGINRNLMVDQLYKGEAKLANGPISPVVPYHNSDLEPVAYDPEGARELLEEAGWDFNRTITLLVPTGNKQRELSGNIIQANLNEIGLDVEIQQQDFPSVLSKVFSKEFDLTLLGWTDTFDPDHLSSTFQTGGQYNLTNFSDEVIDNLIEEAGAARNPEVRKKLYDELQVKLQEKVPAVFLYYPNMLAAVNKRLVNAEPSIFPFEDRAYEWDIKEGE
ncbi:MAG TPA: ABC transporter substrate-binding protein [Halanaerobiales bacterium]|nr:ABC transporter substrate-binding protein [Halanaerobiales bacterium]